MKNTHNQLFQRNRMYIFSCLHFWRYLIEQEYSIHLQRNESLCFHKSRLSVTAFGQKSVTSWYMKKNRFLTSNTYTGTYLLTFSGVSARRSFQLSGLTGFITQAITRASSLQWLTNGQRLEFTLRAKGFCLSKETLLFFFFFPSHSPLPLF